MSDYDAALRAGRRAAIRRMKTPCVVRTVLSVTPAEDGTDVVTYSDPTYSGRCRVKNIANQASALESGSATATRSPRRVDLPWGSPLQPVGAVVFIDDAPAYRITDTSDGDDMTARRYPAERVQ